MTSLVTEQLLIKYVLNGLSEVSQSSIQSISGSFQGSLNTVNSAIMLVNI